MTLPTADHDSLAQAADWYARLLDQDATAHERRRWRQWLAHSESHRCAWRQIEAVGERFRALQDTTLPQAASAGLRSAIAPQRRRLLGLALCGATGASAWLALRHTPLMHTAVGHMATAWTADYRTPVGEIRAVTLPDGSRAWLNTATAIDVDMLSDHRRVELRTGEILVQTAPEPQRPFVVVTAQGVLHAMGTRFSVSSLGEQTRLAVLEGAVQVRTAQSRAQAWVVAGESAQVSPHDIAPGDPVLPEQTAWTQGRLMVRDMPLAAVIAQLARYRHGHLAVSPRIAALRVMGSYPLDDTDRALDLLAHALPIRIERTLPWWVRIEPV